jgi:hypothetical protein
VVLLALISGESGSLLCFSCKFSAPFFYDVSCFYDVYRPPGMIKNGFCFHLGLSHRYGKLLTCCCCEFYSTWNQKPRNVVASIAGYCFQQMCCRLHVQNILGARLYLHSHNVYQNISFQ